MSEVRSILDNLIRERGEDYASISRLLGRNPAYIQQFIKRGTPQKLDEDDRRKLALYFAVDERALGASETSLHNGMVTITPTILNNNTATTLRYFSRVDCPIAFDPRWLDHHGFPTQGLGQMIVQGDAMAPTLADGNLVLIDTNVSAPPYSDGLFALRVDANPIIRRLIINSSDGSVTVRCDNPLYPPTTFAGSMAFTVIGRVLWVGRAIS